MENLQQQQQQEEENNSFHSRGVQQSKHHVHPNSPPPTPTPPSSVASSPSPEFSFAISLHNKSKSSPTSNSNPLTLDLSPADEIFFHGHLLPLHLLAHLPAAGAPRASTNFPPPPAKDQRHTINTANSLPIDHNSLLQNQNNSTSNSNLKPKPKSKSFSLFKTPSNWKSERKSNPDDDVASNFNHKKPRFNAVKRFFRLIKLRPGFLPFWRGNNRDEYFLRQRQQYSTYSGNLRGVAEAARNSDSKLETRGRRVEYWSAPATMKNSPTNSGVLQQVASGTVSPTNYKSDDSTMEELQAAIQAAIAHCKKSIANEDNRIIRDLS